MRPHGGAEPGRRPCHPACEDTGWIPSINREGSMWRRVIGPAVAAFVVAVAGLTGTHPAWAESGPDQPVASSTAAGASSPEMAPSPAEATAALASQTCPAGATCF